jgi:hypothetical protein
VNKDVQHLCAEACIVLLHSLHQILVHIYIFTKSFIDGEVHIVMSSLGSEGDIYFRGGCLVYLTLSSFFSFFLSFFNFFFFWGGA